VYEGGKGKETRRTEKIKEKKYENMSTRESEREMLWIEQGFFRD
jgi:hypothetical protein